MNPVTAAIREEIDEALEKHQLAESNLHTATTRLKHLKQTFELYTGEQLDIEIPGLEATGDEEVAPDGDSNRTVIELPEPAPADPVDLTELVHNAQIDETPPEQETEAAPEEPTEPIQDMGPHLSKRDQVIAHIAGMNPDRDNFRLQDLVDECKINYGIVRDAAKVAVARGLITDQGGRPKMFGMPSQAAEDEEPESPGPSPVVERMNAELAKMAAKPEPAAPAEPPKPLEAAAPDEQLLDLVAEAIESNGPLLEREIPAFIGACDNSTLKRAISALFQRDRIHDTNAGFVAGPPPRSSDITDEPAEETTAMTEEERDIRVGIMTSLQRKPRTGSQLADHLCRTVKDLQPVLEALETEGEIEKERVLGTGFKRWRIAA